MSDELSGEESLVTETGFDPVRANTFETLLTVVNGRLRARGTLGGGLGRRAFRDLSERGLRQS